MKHWSSLLLLALLPAASLAAESPPNPGTALITGSDRGIGFALVQEFERRRWQVIATTIDPAKATDLNAFAKAHPRVTVEKLDVTDTAGIDALAVKLKDRPIDALVNNAGIAGTFDGQLLEKLDQDEFIRVLRVNSYGPLRVSAAFLDHVAASRQRTIRADVAKTGKPITAPTSTPAQVAHAMVLAIEQLRPEQNGKFYSLSSGKEVPW